MKRDTDKKYSTCCIAMAFIGIICILVGNAINNDRMLMFGVGMEFASLMLWGAIYGKENTEDEV